MSLISKILLSIRLIAYALAILALVLIFSSFSHPIDSPFDMEVYRENAEEAYYRAENAESKERAEREESARQMREHMKESNDRWAKEHGFERYEGGTTDWGNDRNRDRD